MLGALLVNRGSGISNSTTGQSSPAGRNLTQQEWEEFGPRDEYHATCNHWPVG
jgi:hypothetical protein